ncbi:MAG: acyl carrier protein, partial [Actinomycetota bacterium]|nr:acyl carrier protein [Actinomycetota bacterium]
AGVSLEQQLAGVPEAKREAVVVGVVREQAAAVLGHGSAAAVDAQRKFKELGFDSLGAVELRNRLAHVSGLQLPSTLVFDHPSPEAVARYLLDRLAPAPPPVNGEASEGEIRRMLGSIPIEQLRSAGLLDPLVRLAGSNGDETEPAGEDKAAARYDVDVDELVRMAGP